LVRGFFFD